ncbi:hypothetical protein HMPREF1153_1730 [Selenomonas sp. CM52]|nr:hypothetical protein HMPREF1153_1730 [Selenomonas sp. CM52]
MGKRRSCAAFPWESATNPTLPSVKLSQSGASVNTSMQILL